MKIKEISENINIPVSTLYDWKKTKPELMKIIEQGLKKEEHLKENVEKMQKDITKIAEYVTNEKLKNEERFLQINKNFMALEILIKSLDKK